ncbi:MAG: hypothetical protein IKB70_13910 [Bacilli bacterium]|nr:hypothetical protein [Bacilli bacterium]
MRANYIENVFNNIWRVCRKVNTKLIVAVTRNSMFLVICDGYTVNITPTKVYSIGDIVVFKNKTTIYRIVEPHSNSIGTKFYFAKGDNDLTRDPPLIERCILEKVTKVFRADKTLQISNCFFKKLLAYSKDDINQ